MINAQECGAVGDGIHDDTAALQTANDLAHNTGDFVWLPSTSASYLVSRAGTAYYDLRITASWRSNDAVLRQAPGHAASVSLMHVVGDNIALEGFVLDGNRAAQVAVSEHRHGIFAEQAAGLRVFDVVARAFTGDGFYLYEGVTDAQFYKAKATNNARNGLTFGAKVTGASLLDSTFAGNGKQQVDSETGGTHVISNILVENCFIANQGASADWALTMSGTFDAQGRGWIVRGCEIRGGVFMVLVDDVLLAGNKIDNPTTKQAVYVQRACSDIRIAGNEIYQHQTAIADRAAILLEGTPGSGPRSVLVAANTVDVASPTGFGVKVDGVVDADVVGNRLQGGACAMRVRATLEDRPVERVSLLGNVCSGYARAGLEVFGNGTAKILELEVRRNTFAGTGPHASITPDVVDHLVIDI